MESAQCETTAEAMPSSITANEVLLVLPRKHNDGETEQPSVIGVRFAALSTDQSSSTKSSTTAIGGPNTLRVAGVVPGTPAAELGPALRVGAELLEIQGQSVAGWYGQCTLQLLRQVASQRPLRLKFSSGMLASPLSVTELVGTPAAASAPLSSLVAVCMGESPDVSKMSQMLAAAPARAELEGIPPAPLADQGVAALA